MLADMDGRRRVRDLLADSLEGVRRADLKVYAIEGEVFCGRRTRAEGPNAFSWVRASFLLWVEGQTWLGQNRMHCLHHGVL